MVNWFHNSFDLFSGPYQSVRRLMSFPENEPEMTEFELSFLCGLIRDRRPQKIIEVGVAAGGTTAVGTEELITKANGVQCDDFTVDSLYNGIKSAMNRQFDAKEIRQDMIARFSPEKIAKQYLEIYKELLD